MSLSVWVDQGVREAADGVHGGFEVVAHDSSCRGVVRYRTVARSATVHSVNMTQKAALGPEDLERLGRAQNLYGEAQDKIAAYRFVVVEMIEKSSYREVARLTGLSTNTLQRWKREAGR